MFLSLLGLRLPIWLVVALVVGASAVVWRTTAFIDSIQLSQVTADFAAYQAGVEKDRADANEKARVEQQRQQVAVSAIRSQLSVAATQRDRMSEELTRQLNEASMDEKNPLSIGVRRYLERLRNSPTPTGTEDGVSLPPH